MVNAKKSVFSMVLIVGLALAAQVSCARQPEPPFPTNLKLKQGSDSLSKRGEYRYVYKMFFKLYDAVLYTTSAASNSEILKAETGYCLQFRYLRAIDKSIISESSTKLLQKNLSEQELSQIQKRIDTLNTAYRSVDKGDRSSLTYIPSEGTTLRINGKKMTTIEGQDFAALYFKIWLGEKPISISLRDHLMGLES